MNKYNTGQTVGLTSRQMPQHNGIYVVSGVHSMPSDAVYDRTDEAAAGFAYSLSGLPGLWAERSLSAIGNA